MIHYQGYLYQAVHRVAYLKKISLGAIATEIPGEVGEPFSLSPEEYNDLFPVVLEKTGDDYEIVDGFHRIAGLVLWAQENSEDVYTIEISVVLAVHEQLIANAADPWKPRIQEFALKRIYKDVGIQYP